MAQTKKKKMPKKATRKAKPKGQDRFHMIEQSAYFNAKMDDFSGDPVHYWLTAESEIDAMLVSKK